LFLDQKILVNGMPLIRLPIDLDAIFPHPVTIVKRQIANSTTAFVKLLLWNIRYCINTEALNIVLAPFLVTDY
jgi:hypothetical protein